MKDNKEKDSFKEAVRNKLTEQEARSERDSELWAKVLGEISPEAKVVKINYTRYIAAAASLLILLSAGIVIYKYNSDDTDQLSQTNSSASQETLQVKKQGSETLAAEDNKSNGANVNPASQGAAATGGTSSIEVHADDQTLAYNLPDGSVVTLNEGAEIKAKDSFKAKRDIEMQGEAYFEVQPDKSRPFTVYFSDYRLVVVGTKFNIRNISAEHVKEVTVTEGIVRVFAKNSKEGIELHKGQQLRLPENEQPVLSDVEADNYISWKTGHLDFTKTSLEQVSNLLARQYEIEIVVSDKIKNCKFTGDLSGLTLEEAIKVISLSSSVKAESSGHKIYITGSGCD